MCVKTNELKLLQTWLKDLEMTIIYNVGEIWGQQLLCNKLQSSDLFCPDLVYNLV